MMWLWRTQAGHSCLQRSMINGVKHASSASPRGVVWRSSSLWCLATGLAVCVRERDLSTVQRTKSQDLQPENVARSCRQTARSQRIHSDGLRGSSAPVPVDSQSPKETQIACLLAGGLDVVGLAEAPDLQVSLTSLRNESPVMVLPLESACSDDHLLKPVERRDRRCPRSGARELAVDDPAGSQPPSPLIAIAPGVVCTSAYLLQRAAPYTPPDP